TLARHPAVDLVTVSVKVPDHYRPVMAAIEAGKHVYCEWPLGRDTEEAVRLLDAAERAGIRHAVGLQGQVSPAINYVKDLVAEGYVGKVLTATMIGCAPNWGAAIDRAYQADRANGANLMTITGGHQIDALCYCLGEFRELTAFAVSQRDRIPLEGTGELVAKDTPDQLVVNGIVGGRNADARLCRSRSAACMPQRRFLIATVDEAGPHAVRARAFTTKAADLAPFLAAEDCC